MKNIVKAALAATLTLLLVSAASARDIKIGNWGSWFAPDTIMYMGLEKGFFNTRIEFVSSMDPSVHIPALISGSEDMFTLIERGFACQPGGPSDAGCVFVAAMTEVENFVLVARDIVRPEKIGPVEGVFRNFTIAGLRCNLDATKTGSVMSMATTGFWSYVQKKNAELHEAGLPEIKLFCGDEDAYKAAIASGEFPDLGKNVIRMISLAGSAKRYAAVLQGVDAAVVTYDAYMRNRGMDANGDLRIVFDDNPTTAAKLGVPTADVRMPDTGIVMKESLYNTLEGQRMVRDFCSGYLRTIEWMREGEVGGEAWNLFFSLTDSKGKSDQETRLGMWKRVLSSATDDCVVSAETIEKMREVAGVSTPINYNFDAVKGVK